jgi:signal transduction histidine kinase
MVARLTSLRFWLLVAMIAAGAVGLVGTYVAFGKIQSAQERRADRHKAEQQAAAIAHQAAAGADRTRFAALQAVLPNNQLVVVRGGRPVFVGPAITDRELEVTASASFPGGRVVLRDYESPGKGESRLLTLVVAGVILLVILAAWLVATLVTRAVRDPVERAVAAADRLAAGDLSARMGASGPDELLRLGRAFDSMADRLESADQDQRRFLADVAHEIATPSNAISGYGIALADGSLVTDAERQEARALIEGETRRLTGLIDDLRALTRLDLAGEARRVRVDLAELCRREVARFAPPAREAGIRLETDLKAAVIDSDPRLIETVLDNLLSNALRYTPSGGRVDLRVRRDRKEIVLSVRDTGIGIPPEQQQRVFDRLYRVDEARDRERGGSGLGLAIAQRAAQALGGRIELESEPGRGSEFRLVLPSALNQRRPNLRSRSRSARAAASE